MVEIIEDDEYNHGIPSLPSGYTVLQVIQLIDEDYSDTDFTLEEAAVRLETSLEEVETALEYYEDHTEYIDSILEEKEAVVEEYSYSDS